VKVSVHVRASTVRDGDFHIDGDPVALHHRRQAFVPGPWTQLDEVHGATVRVVEQPGQFDGEIGDAAVARCPGAVLSVWVGDCAPVVLIGSDGAVGVAHAGWRGALDGVVQAAVRSMASPSVEAILGACIGPCCYEFGAADLARMVERYGSEVSATTDWGTPSLSMPAVVRAALAEVGATLRDESECTMCHPERWFSHRRGQHGRQVMTVRAMVAA
jgi:copper oxidase (laccase) domain-containing protein